MAMRNRRPCPRIDSVGALEHWQTEVQLLRSARNGFPHAYFLPIPGPGAMYLLSVAPVIGVFAHNALPGLPLRPDLTTEKRVGEGGHNICSGLKPGATPCGPTAAVGSHTLLVADTGGVRFVIISLGSAPSVREQSATDSSLFADLLAHVASAAADPALPLLVVAHVDAYYADSGCDCECPERMQPSPQSSQPRGGGCQCDCYTCLSGATSALMRAAHVRPLTARPVPASGNSSSCRADLASFVLGNEAFFGATAVATETGDAAACRKQSGQLGHASPTVCEPGPFCAWFHNASPALVRRSTGSGTIHEEVAPPLSLLCRW